jgi:hypothetical protein
MDKKFKEWFVAERARALALVLYSGPRKLDHPLSY